MVKAVSFYLPQFHPIPENDEWWGKDFTEWTNVRRGRPNFPGHDQPHLPGALGYYDLRDPKVMQQQVALARAHDISAFCFYFYWFNGRRVLQMPLEQFVSRKELDLGFCVCWANENWTRTWDGLEKHVLLSQVYSLDDDRAFIRSLLPLFRDPRYVRVGNRPVLLVYKAERPHMSETAALWRREAVAAGFDGLHIAGVQFGQFNDPRAAGLDAAVEFPPHNFLLPQNRLMPAPELTNPEYVGTVYDYKKVAAQAIAKPTPDYVWYRGVMPAWDNTARRQNTSHIFADATPSAYQYWLKHAVAHTERMHDDGLLFINAWNEWGEGCHLEPDVAHGDDYLKATKAGLAGKSSVDPLLTSLHEEGRLDDAAYEQLAAMFAARERSLFALVQELRLRDERLHSLDDVVHYAPTLRRLRGALAQMPMVEKQAKRVWRRIKGVVK